MLHYPKIQGSRRAPARRCLAFEKYDGTNLHWDWDRELGWHAFGARRDSFDFTDEGIAAFAAEHPELIAAATVFRATLADAVERVFRDHPRYFGRDAYQVFAEFFGPRSFAGRHVAGDAFELRLFDVVAPGVGFIGPREFVNDFASAPIARVVYDGKLTGQFAEKVREGKFNVAEGVVCKGGETGAVWMAKIKTYAYQERLKQAFAENWEQYWE